MSLFIVFEGIDGAGLTTHATLTEKFLQRLGYKVLLTKEPTDGLIGGLIRAALRKEWTVDPATLQLLFAADRSRHVKKVIKPALKKGVHVISDRYLFSSLAYGSLNLSVKWLKTVNSLFPLPDITFLLDISPEEAVKRIKGERFAVELFEEIEKLSKVRKAFLQLAEQYSNFYILKTDDEVEEVQNKIEKIIIQKIDEQK